MVHGVHTSLISVEPHEVERKEDRQKRTKNFELEWWSHRGNTKEAYKMTKPGNTNSLCRAPDLKPPSKFFVYLCNLNTGPAGSLGRLIGSWLPWGHRKIIFLTVAIGLTYCLECLIGLPGILPAAHKHKWEA